MAERHHSGRQDFLDDTRELLSRLEFLLLNYDNPQATEEGVSIDEVFRLLHTIKGNSAIFGFHQLETFTHEVESLCSTIREAGRSLTPPQVEQLLKVHDIIHHMVKADGLLDDKMQQFSEKVLADLQREVNTETPAAPTEDTPEREEAVTKTYWIRFIPPDDIYTRGLKPERIVKDLEELGTCKVYKARKKEAHPEEQKNSCPYYWDILVSTDREKRELEDVFVFAAPVSRITIELIYSDYEALQDTDYLKLGEILCNRGDIKKEDLEAALSRHRKLGEELINGQAVDRDQVESALLEQEYLREMQRKRMAQEQSSSIRIDSAKLDTLVNLVGELVTNQARLSQISGRLNHAELTSVNEQLENLSLELRDITMNMRMLQVGLTFRKFKRIVKDLAGELKKEIRLITAGEDTELDKSVIERLNDPLVHLLRNSIDHGIELPEERERLGKSRTGTITLKANQTGPNVLIKIMDDGRGIDQEKVLARARKQGLITEQEHLPEKEIYNLMFLPGFSTVTEVSNISGRGVGLDIVKRTLELLGGSIDVSSETGRGTTFTLILPLTLAIIEGLLVKVGQNNYIFPLSTVIECNEFAALTGERHQQVLNLRGEALPFVRLRDVFNIKQKENERQEEYVITNTQDKKVCFLVSKVIGNVQTVIKPLGRLYAHADGFSGATILGDGSLAIILDVNSLTNKLAQAG